MSGDEEEIKEPTGMKLRKRKVLIEARFKHLIVKLEGEHSEVSSVAARLYNEHVEKQTRVRCRFCDAMGHLREECPVLAAINAKCTRDSNRA